jgi:hypothetical protein
LVRIPDSSRTLRHLRKVPWSDTAKSARDAALAVLIRVVQSWIYARCRKRCRLRGHPVWGNQVLAGLEPMAQKQPGPVPVRTPRARYPRPAIVLADSSDDCQRTLVPAQYSPTQRCRLRGQSRRSECGLAASASNPTNRHSSRRSACLKR